PRYALTSPRCPSRLIPWRSLAVSPSSRLPRPGVRRDDSEDPRPEAMAGVAQCRQPRPVGRLLLPSRARRTTPRRRGGPRVGPALPGPYERVASTCLLRPLLGNAFHAVGDRHPRFPDLVRAIRAGHLNLLGRLLAPGGTAVLVTDVISSDELPTLRSLPESD